MKSVHQWLDEYGESHQNPINKAIHWVCVPLIMFTALGILWAIPSGILNALVPSGWEPWANWAVLVALLTGLFYLRLSIAMFVGMVVIAVPMLALCYWIERAGLPLVWISIAVFILAWIGQFVGHGIEGKKPSLFEDLQFLLIGPAWLLGFIYRRLGIGY